MNDFQIVNRVNSSGRVVGHWEINTANVKYTDLSGTVQGVITPPEPFPSPLTFPFYVNALGGAMLDTSAFHSALPTTIDLSNAFADAGLRLPTDQNGNTISGLFNLNYDGITSKGIRPSWWSGTSFYITCAFTGECQIVPGNLLNFLCNGSFSLKSVDRAWLYKNNVWGTAYIEVASPYEFITYEF